MDEKGNTKEECTCKEATTCCSKRHCCCTKALAVLVLLLLGGAIGYLMGSHGSYYHGHPCPMTTPAMPMK